MINPKDGEIMGYGNTEVFLTPEERENLIRKYLGKQVSVTIDRPIGFHHETKGIHLHYTVNYGFLPGVIGVAEPVAAFTGRIIGVVRRKDDNEDKFVAAPVGVTLTAAEIQEQIWFVEKYFDSTVFSIFDGA